MSIEGQGHFLTIYFPGFVCTRPRYQVSVYRTIGPLVSMSFCLCVYVNVVLLCLYCQILWIINNVFLHLASKQEPPSENQGRRQSTLQLQSGIYLHNTKYMK